jgi:hypothetical protein
MQPNFVVFFTTAPSKYDLPTTYTIDEIGYDRFGRVVRQVGTRPRLAPLQATAYTNGKFAVLDENELRDCLKRGELILYTRAEKKRFSFRRGHLNLVVCGVWCVVWNMVECRLLAARGKIRLNCGLF